MTGSKGIHVLNVNTYLNVPQKVASLQSYQQCLRLIMPLFAHFSSPIAWPYQTLQHTEAHRPSTALQFPNIFPLINVMAGFPLKMFQIRIPLQGCQVVLFSIACIMTVNLFCTTKRAQKKKWNGMQEEFKEGRGGSFRIWWKLDEEIFCCEASSVLCNHPGETT